MHNSVELMYSKKGGRLLADCSCNDRCAVPRIEIVTCDLRVFLMLLYQRFPRVETRRSLHSPHLQIAQNDYHDRLYIKHNMYHTISISAILTDFLRLSLKIYVSNVKSGRHQIFNIFDNKKEFVLSFLKFFPLISVFSKKNKR